MTEHRFHVGDLVFTHFGVSTRLGETVIGARAGKHVSGIYEVSCLLPELFSGERQYRIKCDGQPERVVQESHLAAVVHKVEPHH